MFFEMGSVFRNEKRIDLILFQVIASFSFMVKGRTLVGRARNNSKHKPESFCFATD